MRRVFLFGSEGLRRARTRRYGEYADNRASNRTEKTQEDTLDTRKYNRSKTAQNKACCEELLWTRRREQRGDNRDNAIECAHRMKMQLRYSGDIFEKKIAQLERTYLGLEKLVVEFGFGLKVKRGVGRGSACEVGEV